LISKSGPCSVGQVVYSSWLPGGFFRPWAVSFVITRSVSQIDSLEWSKLGNSTSSEIGMMFLQFRCPGTKNKKIAPFAKQTSLDHVLKNKKKKNSDQWRVESSISTFYSFLFFQQVFTLSIFWISYLHLHLNSTMIIKRKPSRQIGWW